ncbi:MAG: twin-arginine translocase subunit TatB [Devosia nanyangense]|uniref:Sec-independent protein translocase protein TatB n=1 Tax=Devosia nanyangense TaxID=1228055 RepID=A0A933NZW5_9HYPH|nr:twin-arginine translocase subunit TatB [Devosia nanyangense]
MLGVGWTEMLLIGVVALIVIGPKDLPVVMNRLGKVVASIRRMGGEFQREINKSTGLDTVTDLRRSITEPLKKTAAEITREFNKTTPSGAVVPSGAITPKDPKAESVVEEIKTLVGVPMSGPVTRAPAKPVESPAPIEAIAPAAKPARKPRAKAAAPAATPVAEAPKPVAKRPAAPRKPRAPKPKAEA